MSKDRIHSVDRHNYFGKIWGAYHDYLAELRQFNYWPSSEALDLGLMSQVVVEEMLPTLTDNFEENLELISMLMGFVHAGDLPVETRVSLGLPEVPEYSLVKVAPTLLPPFSGKDYLLLCPMAEEYLLESVYPELCPTSSYNCGYPMMELWKCVIAKRREVCSGICFETTEFPNGTVLFKNMWYVIRNPGLVAIDEHIGNAFQNRSRINEDEPSPWPQILELPDIPAVVQPSRRAYISR